MKASVHEREKEEEKEIEKRKGIKKRELFAYRKSQVLIFLL